MRPAGSVRLGSVSVPKRREVEAPYGRAKVWALGLEFEAQDLRLFLVIALLSRQQRRGRPGGKANGCHDKQDAERHLDRSYGKPVREPTAVKAAENRRGDQHSSEQKGLCGVGVLGEIGVILHRGANQAGGDDDRG